MGFNADNYRMDILKHYSKNWGNGSVEKYWSIGPIEEFNTHFSILEFKPSLERDMWTYATCGLSTYTHISPIELHMFSSKQDESLIELLSTVCFYHNVDANLNLGHTINFGRPWQDKSLALYGLISLPYLDGPALEIMNCSEQKAISFYWLIPITQRELEYKKEFGLEALEHKMETTQINYINPNIRSII